MTSEDTGGEVVFRKDVLSFSSTKNSRYPLLEERNGLFSWHISPLFDFATSNKSEHEPFYSTDDTYTYTFAPHTLAKRQFQILATPSVWR
ncbi:hypothetical protein ccbrp13_14940 [Ktedonobacteria bacterium brp13]|nr:hypothetical protein ccbrp13_14940 [Ktedonobacteria bacterium brp13]